MSPKKKAGKPARGFTDEERAAMRERARELKAGAQRDGESDLLGKIAEMPEPDRAMAGRLYLLLELLYATGMRVSELVELKRAAVMRDASFLTVRGKGGKERIVPLTDRARDAVKAYLTRLEPGAWLFPAGGESGCCEGVRVVETRGDEDRRASGREACGDGGGHDVSVRAADPAHRPRGR